MTVSTTRIAHRHGRAERSVLADEARRPFLSGAVVELGVLVGLFVVYNVVRALPAADPRTAIEHAHRVLALEGPVFQHLEVPLNRWLEATPVLAVAACYYYAALHYVMTPAVLLLSRHRGGPSYARAYWTLVLASALALVGYALYPTAPPRLVPDLGIVDVMRSYADHGWWGSAASAPRGIGDATNQFAAMPSMHVGWALWCAIQMWGFGRPAWKALAVAYPSILVVVVLATGNHFLLDVVAGAACVVVAHVAVGIILRLRESRPAHNGVRMTRQRSG
ncbi:MAG: hypothetical protein JWO46_2726 [Nocardioidaceae bacterium]|nr:hypothetical protein [Nocardioidaceae bacterium]